MSELTGPRQVVLVTCRSEKDGIMPVAWHTPLSKNPPLYAIVIGKKRYCHRLISGSGAFCVNFIPDDMLDKVKKCGSSSSENTDKFGEFGIEKEECDEIPCPRIRDSLGFIECRVAEVVDTGDHDIFVGQIVNERMNRQGKRLYHISGESYRVC